ncbi:hypothetical protein [Micromonospora chalcea]|uniref:hypothetical protein n=1 Tax=Micromonospora chalcea TaxID=1874 RepID=UPI003F4A0D86
MGTDREELARRFTAELHQGVDTLAALGYPAKRFQLMLREYKGVETARKLVLSNNLSDGLWRLKQMGKLDMSVEMWVLLPWYEELFDEAVRDRAYRKLRAMDFDVDAEIRRRIDAETV